MVTSGNISISSSNNSIDRNNNNNESQGVSPGLGKMLPSPVTSSFLSYKPEFGGTLRGIVKAQFMVSTVTYRDPRASRVVVAEQVSKLKFENSNFKIVSSTLSLASSSGLAR